MGAPEAEGVTSHQLVRVVGVGLQTQAGGYHLTDSFFNTFSPFKTLIFEECILYMVHCRTLFLCVV